MFEIESDEGIDGGFEFDRVERELCKLAADPEGYFVLYCPRQGTLRVELHDDGFRIEQRSTPNVVHYQITSPNEGERLSMSTAKKICRKFYDGFNH